MASVEEPKREPAERAEVQQPRWKELEDRSEFLKGRRDSIISRCYIAVILFLVSTTIGGFALMHSEITVNTRTFGLIVFVVVLIGLVSHLALKRAQLRMLTEEMRVLDFQIDLAKDDVDQIERRAEKIVNISSYQIKQYHDFNLRQNRWIFLLGFACVAAGILVVMLTFAVVIVYAEGIEDKVIISVVGGIGAILSNFVGTIYLVMHRSAANSLRDFHSKLVESHRMLVGNLVASRISEKKKREDVFAKLSLEIMGEKQKEKIEQPSS